MEREAFRPVVPEGFVPSLDTERESAVGSG
jgi:hypothetical protein